MMASVRPLRSLLWLSQGADPLHCFSGLIPFTVSGGGDEITENLVINMVRESKDQ